MKLRLISAIAVMVCVMLVSGVMTVFADNGYIEIESITAEITLEETQPILLDLAWSKGEILSILIEFLPAFQYHYDYDLLADLDEVGLPLEVFAHMMHNYLNFMFLSGRLSGGDFDAHDNNWLFYYVDGVVWEMSQSPAVSWGNLSLMGLFINNVYFETLGPILFNRLFEHNHLIFIANAFSVYDYFNFLIHEDTLDVLLPFGEAATSFLSFGETYLLYNILGGENMAALGVLDDVQRIDFLAIALAELMIPDFDELLYDNMGLSRNPRIAANGRLYVSMGQHISENDLDQRFVAEFLGNTAIVITSDLRDAKLNLFFKNTGEVDFWMMLETFDADGNWHIFAELVVPAGQSLTRQILPHYDLDSVFRIVVYNLHGHEFSGDFAMRKTDTPLEYREGIR